MRAAPPWGIVAAGIAAALALAGGAGAATAEITPITAVFVPAELATQYTVATTSAAPAGVTYTWTLHLTLVDPAGAAAPGEPGSGAGVDPTCDNAHLAGGSAGGGETFVWKQLGKSFTWFHGDKGSYPGGYGCDHTKMGPSGHQGVVSVVVATSTWSCTATISGTNLTEKPQTGPAPTCKTLAASAPPATTTTPAATETAATETAAGSSGGGFPVWAPIVIAAGLLAAAAWWFFGRATAGDPCAGLAARCKELRAKAAAAAKAAADAAAKAKAAETAYEQAKAASAKAQAAANAADRPDEGESWIEDADTCERITEHDLALEKADGGSHWGDPAYRKQLREQEKAQAHAALDAAKQAEAAAKSAADAAASAATAAAGSAAKAQADADAACKAADDCVAAAAAAKQAAEDAARRTQAETPHTVEKPPPPPPPPPPPTTVDGGTTDGPTEPPRTPPADPGDVSECEDGCDPDVQSSSVDLELFLVWAADVEIDGAFQFSDDDVEDALRAFENFKAVVDVAEFAEGFAESGGDLVSGSAGVDAILNTFTTGLDQGFSLSGHSNVFDPSSYGEDAVVDALKNLIEKINPKRALGTWTMKCPLVRVHVTCTRVKECRGGRWVLTSHTLSVEYGKPIRYESTSADNWDQTNPGRGAADTKRRLLQHFENRNRAATNTLRDFAKACAAAK